MKSGDFAFYQTKGDDNTMTCVEYPTIVIIASEKKMQNNSILEMVMMHAYEVNSMLIHDSR